VHELSSLSGILLTVVGAVCVFVALSFPFYLIYSIVYLLFFNKHGKGSFNLVYLIISFIFFTISAYMFAQFSTARPKAMLRMCEANCKNISTALEMYAADNDRRYPGRLELLTPDYISSLPRCASGARHSYADSYQTDRERGNYTFYCKGDNHIIRIRIFDVPVTGNVGAASDYPLYSNRSGLIVKSGSGTDGKHTQNR